jgi:YetA-like protein
VSQAWKIPLSVRESDGLARRLFPVRCGVPFPRGLLSGSTGLVLRDGAGRSLALQVRPLLRWADGSVRWLLIDSALDIDAHGECQLTLEPAEATVATDLDLCSDADGVRVSAAGSTFVVSTADGLPRPVGHALSLRARQAGAGDLRLAIRELKVEESGSARVVTCASGALVDAHGAAVLQVMLRTHFSCGSGRVVLEIDVHNPRAARHEGGLWDLGDAGSSLLESLTLEIRPPVGTRLQLQVSPQAAPMEIDAGPLSLLQVSSGGERWASRNHVDSVGQVPLAHRGYRLQVAGHEQHGDRAQPRAMLLAADHVLGLEVRQFWQNFPKALVWEGGALQVDLFPAGSGPHELQGGERKRHFLTLALAPDGTTAASALASDLIVRIAADWLEGSGAVTGCFAADLPEPVGGYLATIAQGPRSFFGGREAIDEYGWRNFGEVYADHEAVRHKGEAPLISHYNNQYDFLLGAAQRYCATGEAAWGELMHDAARHVMDIDIYQTDADRPAYNNGLFWHTDHYEPAETCTHRTYSSRNVRGRHYGGGPSNEHNYTSGLRLYYALTGDDRARESVLRLADWVIAMDLEDAEFFLGLLRFGPSGLASRTVSDDYHGPGRGAGNSINALLDAFEVTGSRRYLDYASSLVKRCIHPADDIATRHLDDPEHRWSYLVFLQVLARYVEVLRGISDTGAMRDYALASLRHYAHWIVIHERPYSEQLDRVEIPSETWPAQDIRKAHVLQAVAHFEPDAQRRAQFEERARHFFDRCLQDLLGWPTAHLARPRILILVYATEYLRLVRLPAQPLPTVDAMRQFGTPQTFRRRFGRLRRVAGKLHALWGRAGRGS